MGHIRSSEAGSTCDLEEYPTSKKRHKRVNIPRLVIQVCALMTLLMGIVLGATHSPVLLDIQYGAMAFLFGLGLLLIAGEDTFQLHKSMVTLLLAASLWAVRAACIEEQSLLEELHSSLGGVGAVVFFLLPAMAIVESIDMHGGFSILRIGIAKITNRDERLLLPVVGFLTFFLSAILDNLTSTIVMIQLLRGLVQDEDKRRTVGALVVISANSGGAWSPVGDVTTTMLWITGKISAVQTITTIFLPSLVSMLVPLFIMHIGIMCSGVSSREMRSVEHAESRDVLEAESEEMEKVPEKVSEGRIIFIVGIILLTCVPVFKVISRLPPYMGCLLALGLQWAFVDFWHSHQGANSVAVALTQVDIPGVMFFVGMLLSVGALDASGLLKLLAEVLADACHGSVYLLAGSLGVASALVDNVPLVQATMDMFDNDYPKDHMLWRLAAYCAGTGGSILIIGSVAGVAFMNMEHVSFAWYTCRVTVPASLGYLAGIFTFMLLDVLRG